MLSLAETVQIFVLALVVSAPWLFAMALAVRDISRNPNWFTYLSAVVVVVGGLPAAIVYFAYRTWRGFEPGVLLRHQGRQRGCVAGERR